MNFEGISLAFRRIHFIRLAIIAILINTVVFVALVLPNHQKISDLQNRYSDLRSQVRAEQADLRVQQVRLAKLEQANRDLEYLYETVLSPKKTGVTDIRLELQRLLSPLQVDQTNFSYNYEDVKNLNLRQFRLAMPVHGSYRNVRRFINSIERSKHFLILERVDLSSERTDDQLYLDFRISTYLTQNGV